MGRGGQTAISRGFLSLTIVQVFEDLQKMLNVTEKEPGVGTMWSRPAAVLQVGGSMIQTNPLFRTVLGLCLALATVTIGLYAL